MFWDFSSCLAYLYISPLLFCCWLEKETGLLGGIALNHWINDYRLCGSGELLGNNERVRANELQKCFKNISLFLHPFFLIIPSNSFCSFKILLQMKWHQLKLHYFLEFHQYGIDSTTWTKRCGVVSTPGTHWHFQRKKILFFSICILASNKTVQILRPVCFSTCYGIAIPFSLIS